MIQLGKVALHIPQISVELTTLGFGLRREAMIEYCNLTCGTLSISVGGQEAFATRSTSGGSHIGINYTRHLASAPLVYLLDGIAAMQSVRIVLREDVLHEVLAEIEFIKSKFQAPNPTSPVSVVEANPATMSEEETYVRVQTFKVSNLSAALSIIRATSRDKKTLRKTVGFLHVFVRNVQDVELTWPSYGITQQQSSVYYIILALKEFYKKHTVEQFHKILVAAVVK
jgi:hypothetical protein